MSLRGFLKLPGRALASIFGGSSFLESHSTAISFAFWSSLIVTGTVALMVIYWPATLAALVAYPVYGLSIAALVGTNSTAQIIAVSAVSYIMTNAVIYTLALLGTIGSWLCECCDDDPAKRQRFMEDGSEEDSDDDIPIASRQLGRLGSPSRVLKVMPSMTDPDLSEEDQPTQSQANRLATIQEEAPSFSPAFS